MRLHECRTIIVQSYITLLDSARLTMNVKYTSIMVVTKDDNRSVGISRPIQLDNLF